MPVIADQLQERKDYQQYILERLQVDNEYEIRLATGYNPAFAMDTEILFRFLEATQSEAMAKLKQFYKEQTRQTILNYINNEINKKARSVLDVLKKGVDFDNRVKLTLMYKKPATSFNKKASELYDQNILSVMEEVWHKEGERIDLVIFINGIAIFTIELKCNTSGQNYEDAVSQYKYERDCNTRLMKFKAGAVCHFAVDLNEIYMCTCLKGGESSFLPFNRGERDANDRPIGKGNPHNESGINVSYFWEDILKKDTVIELLEKYIYVDKKIKTNPETGQHRTSEELIFPRYHQLDAIRSLVADMVENKTSCNYLIEHSAGSGKTYTIAWLSHRLSSLHDMEENNIFDSIIIVTDRIVVDRQLQRAVLSMEHKEGQIKVLADDSNSGDLAEAIGGNTKIIVTTIHKFIYVLQNNGFRNLDHKTFAIIIDEAHSSTSGSYMAALTTVLAADDAEEKTVEELITEEINKNGKQANTSMIAFTATPKPSTLQLFGTTSKIGKKQSFHLYPMKQAIEERFILDVTSNYITYKTYFHLNKTIEDDPELKTMLAKKKIAKYIELHDTNIAQKIEIIVEHFRNHVMQMLDGKAKAMVVTSSRQAAVKYYKEFVRYITEHGYNTIHPLVAFSGKVRVDGIDYSEPEMNNISEEKLAAEFDKDNYHVLIVANKYQTGFDQSKLCAMYVDKKLRDIACVQTLSRLNRICDPYSKQTFVLDFKNSYDDVKSAFSPYFLDTILAETITPSDIRAIEAQIDSFNFLDYDDVSLFNEYLYKDRRSGKDKTKMWSLLDRSLQIIKKQEMNEQKIIRAAIKRFQKFYSFIIQATSFEDIDLHKKYNFLMYLVKEIEITGGPNFDVADKITASDFKQKKKGDKSYDPIESKPEVKLTRPEEVVLQPDQEKLLSEIIDDINNSFGMDFELDVSAKSLLQVRDILLKDEKLKASAKANEFKNFKFSYNDAAQDALISGFEKNTDFFTLLLNNDDVKTRLMQVFMKDVYTKLKSEE